MSKISASLQRNDELFTKSMHCQSFVKPPQSKQVIAQVVNASMRFGQRLLWQDVNFSILSGEFVALLGANGAGKTTLLRSLLKLLPLSGGTITLGNNIRVGYVPQLKDIEPKLPIRGRDLVQLGLDGENYLFGLFDPKKTLGSYWQTAKQKKYLVDKAIAEVGGEAFCDAPLPMLSGGEQQRMRIAQALVAEPDILLMDEPLLSLDVASQYVVSDILSHRKHAHHTAIIMISHELAPIIPLIDKVVYIENTTAKIGGIELINHHSSRA